MSVKIFVRESGIESSHLEESMIETSIMSNDTQSGEARLLKAFIDAEFEAPAYPQTIAGFQLTNWVFDESEGCDVCEYAAY